MYLSYINLFVKICLRWGFQLMSLLSSETRTRDIIQKFKSIFTFSLSLRHTYIYIYIYLKEYFACPISDWMCFPTVGVSPGCSLALLQSIVSYGPLYCIHLVGNCVFTGGSYLIAWNVDSNQYMCQMWRVP